MVLEESDILLLLQNDEGKAPTCLAEVLAIFLDEVYFQYLVSRFKEEREYWDDRVINRLPPASKTKLDGSETNCLCFDHYAILTIVKENWKSDQHSISSIYEIPRIQREQFLKALDGCINARHEKQGHKPQDENSQERTADRTTANVYEHIETICKILPLHRKPVKYKRRIVYHQNLIDKVYVFLTFMVDIGETKISETSRDNLVMDVQKLMVRYYGKGKRRKRMDYAKCSHFYVENDCALTNKREKELSNTQPVKDVESTDPNGQTITITVGPCTTTLPSMFRGRLEFSTPEITYRVEIVPNYDGDKPYHGMGLDYDPDELRRVNSYNEHRKNMLRVENRNICWSSEELIHETQHDFDYNISYSRDINLDTDWCAHRHIVDEDDTSMLMWHSFDVEDCESISPIEDGYADDVDCWEYDKTRRVKQSKKSPISDAIWAKSDAVESDCQREYRVKGWKGGGNYNSTNIAVSDDTGAQFNLFGVCYLLGDGVEIDEERAIYWFKKAAEENCVQALYNLGICYAQGKGVTVNCSEAVMYYTKAAEQDHAGAQYNLAICYSKGMGVEKDEAKSIELFVKAAEQGFADAQCNLGICYAMGIGVEKDEVKSTEWFIKAAEQGSTDAQFNLGLCYAAGYGVKKNWREAISWYDRAAENNHSAALQKLQEPKIRLLKFWLK